jgi:hypothetical protein
VPAPKRSRPLLFNVPGLCGVFLWVLTIFLPIASLIALGIMASLYRDPDAIEEQVARNNY